MAPTVAFDVIGTLFSLERLRAPLQAAGAPGTSLETWFAQALRDFFAYSHADGYVPLAEVLDGALARTLTTLELDAGEQARATVTSALRELDAAPGAGEGCAALVEAGCPLVALTNGSLELAESLLDRAGLREHFRSVRSCDEIGISKPDARVYALVEPRAGEHTWMVAAHAWDVAGARRAGLRGAWVATSERVYQDAYPRPEVEAPDLAAAARGVLEWTG